MEISKDLLISVQTSLEQKGPYKLQIRKATGAVVQTIKIRMKDDITHIISLSQGEYDIIILRNDKEFFKKQLILPNFEIESQIELIINDSGIEINQDKIILYKSIDDILKDVIGEPKSNKQINKKSKTKENNSKNNKDVKVKEVMKEIKPSLPVSKNNPQPESNETQEKKETNLILEEKIQINKEENNDINDLTAFIRNQLEINKSLQEQISQLQKEVQRLQIKNN